MSFYTGELFRDWKGDLFVGSLKFGLLVRLKVDGNEIIGEKRMLNGRFGRIRDVIQRPDDLLYLLTDARDGLLLKFIPIK
jgi:glucose/arabinose dehydrogenase